MVGDRRTWPGIRRLRGLPLDISSCKGTGMAYTANSVTRAAKYGSRHLYNEISILFGFGFSDLALCLLASCLKTDFTIVCLFYYLFGSLTLITNLHMPH